LEFFPPNGTEPARIVQRLKRPCVYFDHWAHARFSRDSTLGERFAELLHEHGGTFVLSILNLAEFSGLTDVTQGRAAERFLESLLPRLYFMRFSPPEVIEAEIQLWTGKTSEGPAGDAPTLHLFGLPLAEGRGGFHARGLFGEAVRQRDTVRELLTSLVDRVRADYRQYFAATTNRAKLVASIDSQLEKLSGLPRPTQALRLALIEQLFLEGRAEIDSHDAVDMLHALVPASYCQFVLLDGRWCDLVERARRRLSRAGITGVGNVYSERRDGISEFLATLQAYSRA
jgi:hypothetical protein